jgi:fatty acyl-CoA reductase
MSAIASFFAQRSVFITGGSGYIGQQIIEKLLRSCPEIEGIYVLTRPKKGQSAQQRLDKLTTSPLFDRLRSRQPSFSRKIIAISGDVEQPGMGINGYDHSRVTSNASLFIHSAATLSFTDPIRVEAQTNLIGTMNAIQLCKECKQSEAFVFLSSVVSQFDKKSIKECIYDPPITSRELLSLLEILDDHQIELLTPSIMRQIPNTYGLTKSVTEHHLSQVMDNIPTAIIRMTPIGPSLAEPFEGWVDNLTASNGVYAGIGLGMLPVLDCNGDTPLDITPVDVVTNFIIAAAWQTATNKSKDASSPVTVYNFVTGNKSPFTMRQFTQLCTKNTQQYPLSRRLTNSGSTTSRNKAFLAVCSFWLQIRCMAVDTYLLLSGQTPKATKLFQLNQSRMGTYDFFINQNNRLDEDNVQGLEDRLTPTDKQTFSFDRKIDMDHYYKISWLGLKKYYFKDVPKEERNTVVENEATHSTVGNKELKNS